MKKIISEHRFLKTFQGRDLSAVDNKINQWVIEKDVYIINEKLVDFSANSVLIHIFYAPYVVIEENDEKQKKEEE